MKALVISGVAEAPQKFEAHGVTHAVSFKDHSFQWPMIDYLFQTPSKNWLRFEMYDRYFQPGTPEHSNAGQIVDVLLDFAKELPADAIVGLNCYMGISRSTAAGLILCAAKYPLEEAKALFWSARGPCGPNETLLEIADDRLDLNGQLIEYGDQLFLAHRRLGGFIAHRRGIPAPDDDPYDDQ